MKYIITERQHRLISEEEIKLRRRLHTIEKLIEDEISEIYKDGGIEFTDRFEFMQIVVNDVVEKFLEMNENEEFDEDELKEFVGDKYGDYLLSMYPHDDDEEEDDED